MSKRSKGFTLIELVVTIALLGLVVALSAGVMSQIWGLFRSYNIRRDMHDAEHQLRQVVRGISRDFRYGSAGAVEFNQITANGFSFIASTYTPSGNRGTTTVSYTLVDHPTRTGYRIIGRSGAPTYWDRNSPVGGFPITAVRNMEVMPLDIDANVVTDGDTEITHLRILIWTGFAERMFNQNPNLVEIDLDGNPTGPLDPFEMKIAVVRLFD